MESFRYPGLPKYVAFTLIPLLVFFAVAIFTTLVLKSALPVSVSVLMATIIAVVFIFPAFLLYKMYKRTDISFIVTESGLLMQSRKRDLFIDWAEIGDIRSADILKRLELYNRTGEHMINIHYELTEFSQFRLILLSSVDHLTTDNQKIFSTSIYIRLSLIFLTGILFYVAIRSALSGMMEAMRNYGGTAVIFVFVYLWKNKSIMIEQDKVVIKSALRVTTVLFQDISAVRLYNKVISYGRGRPGIGHTKLIIARKRNRPIKLSSLQGGPIPLYRSLKRSLVLSLPRNRHSNAETGAVTTGCAEG